MPQTKKPSASPARRLAWDALAERRRQELEEAKRAALPQDNGAGRVCLRSFYPFGPYNVVISGL